MSSSLTILAWHNVTPTPFFSGGAGALERQLKLVRRLGNVVPLGSSLRTLREGGPLPRRAVALTFDDGYRDNVDVGLPMLRDLEIPATFFLVPGFIDRTARCWWESVAWALGRSRLSQVTWRGATMPAGTSPGRARTADSICADIKYLAHAERDAEISRLIDELRPAGSQEEVAELFADWDGARRIAAEAGVGAHTNEHPILSCESEMYQFEDLASCREGLMDRLDAPVDLLAYPNGGVRDYGRTTIDAARAAGFSGALTTRDGINSPDTPPYEIHRFVLSPRWDAGMVRLIARIMASAALGRTA